MKTSYGMVGFEPAIRSHDFACFINFPHHVLFQRLTEYTCSLSSEIPSKAIVQVNREVQHARELQGSSELIAAIIIIDYTFATYCSYIERALTRARARVIVVLIIRYICVGSHGQLQA